MRGALIPWTRWGGGDFSLTSAVCQVELPWKNHKLQVAAAQVEINNLAKKPREVQLFVALRPMGAAGGPVYRISVGDKKDSFLVDERMALIPSARPRRSASPWKTTCRTTPCAEKCPRTLAWGQRPETVAG